MIFKNISLLFAGLAAATSVAAAVSFDCSKVRESALNNTVVNDGSLIYAADAYPPADILIDTNKNKQLYKALKKRLVSYWLKSSGYESIRVETTGMATQVAVCEGEQFAILYVPLDTIKIYEKNVEAQEPVAPVEIPQPLQFERMQ